MSVELRRLILDPESDPQFAVLGTVVNRLIDMVNGNTGGRLWLLDDDGNQQAIIGSEGINAGDVLSAGNYPLWSRSAAGNHARFQHSDETHNVLAVQDAGLTIQGTVGITGAVTIVGNTAITGTFGVTGNSTLTGTLTVTGATTLQSTLAVTGTTTLTGALLANGAVTLGDAAADAITVTGTMTVSEILTLSKGLVVDTTTLVVDAVNNRVGILTATPTTQLDVIGLGRFSGSPAFPASGSGLEVFINGGIASVQAYNRTGSAYLPMTVIGSYVALQPSGVTAIEANGTGVGFNGSSPVAPPSLSGSAAALYDATTRQLINDIKDLLVDVGLAQ